MTSHSDIGRPSHSSKFVAVVDPAGRVPETSCFNLISGLSPVDTYYYLPGLGDNNALKSIDWDRVACTIILGSSASVHDRTPWQKELEDFIARAMLKSIPILAVCYGHQLIGALHGVPVRFYRQSQEKVKGFRNVTVNDEQLGLKMSSGDLVVSHGEILGDLPRGFRIWVEGDDHPFDGLKHIDKPIWTIQPHPEATRLFCQNQNFPVPDIDLSFGHSLVERFLVTCCQ